MARLTMMWDSALGLVMLDMLEGARIAGHGFDVVITTLTSVSGIFYATT